MRRNDRITAAVAACALLGCTANIDSGTGRGSGEAVAPELEEGLGGLEAGVEQNRRVRIAIFDGNALASGVFEDAMNAELRVLGLESITYVDHPMTPTQAPMGELLGVDVEDPVDPTIPTGTASAPCPFAMRSPPVSASELSCRFLVSNAQDRARVRSAQALADSPMRAEIAQEAPDPDEVRAWYAQAVGFGIDAAVSHALQSLRSAGVCDRDPTVSESAFELGVEDGRRAVREAVRAQEAVTPRTQCNVDWIVSTAVATLSAEPIAEEAALCPGYEPPDTDAATHLAAASREQLAGIRDGIAEQARTERARLVREWVCEVPDDGGGGGGGGGEGDPLVLDLDGDGVHVEPLSRGAFFDFGDTGRVLTEWLWGGDGFLVLDRDGDGDVVATELFGDVTITEDGARAADGFAALALYDEPARGGNGDGRIDAEDEVFDSLAVWNDRDGDARTDDEELQPLSAHGIDAIEYRYQRFIAGDREGLAADVWFTWNRVTESP